ncbi:hypothetical protein OSTOST_03835 [Ostertagia ostertagi]
MRGLIILSACLFLNCFASPVAQLVKAVNEKAASELATTAYALDLSAPVSLSGFQCIRNNYYNVAFIRAYTPVGQGQIDTYACANIQNACCCGIGLKILHDLSTKIRLRTVCQKLDEMYSNLRNSEPCNSIYIGSRVTSPVQLVRDQHTQHQLHQQHSHPSKCNNMVCPLESTQILMNGIKSPARQPSTTPCSGRCPGVLTHQKWYWSTYGSGVSNETPANFSDFLSFAGWTSPSVKQFAQVESVCGITVNRDIYSTSSAAVAGMARREKGEQQIIVGGLGLGAGAFTGKAEIKQ